MYKDIFHLETQERTNPSVHLTKASYETELPCEQDKIPIAVARDKNDKLNLQDHDVILEYKYNFFIKIKLWVWFQLCSPSMI